MFHVDVDWFETLNETSETAIQSIFEFTESVGSTPKLFTRFTELYEILIRPDVNCLEKEIAMIESFTELVDIFGTRRRLPPSDSDRLVIAARFIRDNWDRKLGLSEICTASGLSASYLTRSFRQRFGMTPYAYLINHRIQEARYMLRNGLSIADVAHEALFFDQAHFQRAFKRLTAVNPGAFVHSLRG
ncbi:hypothetical protein ASE37_24265 [Rhizobium sp. Root268]|nr:hypothetical protein ASC86_24500 [Rhizobium sp. Root1212]KRD28653.1 hypothetical protein ASE37_24265 [Rhizobium sp. Root268]